MINEWIQKHQKTRKNNQGKPPKNKEKTPIYQGKKKGQIYQGKKKTKEKKDRVVLVEIDRC